MIGVTSGVYEANLPTRHAGRLAGGLVCSLHNACFAFLFRAATVLLDCSFMVPPHFITVSCRLSGSIAHAPIAPPDHPHFDLRDVRL